MAFHVAMLTFHPIDIIKVKHYLLQYIEPYQYL